MVSWLQETFSKPSDRVNIITVRITERMLKMVNSPTNSLELFSHPWVQCFRLELMTCFSQVIKKLPQRRIFVMYFHYPNGCWCGRENYLLGPVQICFGSFERTGRVSSSSRHIKTSRIYLFARWRWTLLGLYVVRMNVRKSWIWKSFFHFHDHGLVYIKKTCLYRESLLPCFSFFRMNDWHIPISSNGMSLGGMTMSIHTVRAPVKY